MTKYFGDIVNMAKRKMVLGQMDEVMNKLVIFQFHLFLILLCFYAPFYQIATHTVTVTPIFYVLLHSYGLRQPINARMVARVIF